MTPRPQRVEVKQRPMCSSNYLRAHLAWGATGAEPGPSVCLGPWPKFDIHATPARAEATRTGTGVTPSSLSGPACACGSTLSLHFPLDLHLPLPMAWPLDFKLQRQMQRQQPCRHWSTSSYSCERSNHIYIHVCVYLCIYTCAHISTHTHICIYACVYTSVSVSISVSPGGSTSLFEPWLIYPGWGASGIVSCRHLSLFPCLLLWHFHLLFFHLLIAPQWLRAMAQPSMMNMTIINNNIQLQPLFPPCLFVKPYANIFSHIILLNPYNPMEAGFFKYLFYKWRNWGSGKLSNSPKIINKILCASKTKHLTIMYCLPL